MSVLSLINQIKIRQSAAYWVPYLQNGRYAAREEYLRFMKTGCSEIKIVCGECDPSFYDSPEFIQALSIFLKEKGGAFSIAFNKKGATQTEALERLQRDNAKFWNFLCSLSETEKKRVSLIWLRQRPSQHYMIVDKKDLVLEDQHENGEPRDVYFVADNRAEARTWLGIYDQLVVSRGAHLDVP